MNIHNFEIAAKFNELANLLEIEGANPFRVRAYRNAARIIDNSTQEMSALVKEGRGLSEIGGIGHDLAAKIVEITTTGKLQILADVKKRLPRGLGKMLKISGLGPKRIGVLYRKLKVGNIAELNTALNNGSITSLDGFGEKIAENIKAALKKFSEQDKGIKFVKAERVIKPLLAYIKTISGVEEAVPAGSYRRRKEIVGDLDVLVVAKNGKDVVDKFVQYENVEEVLLKGETRSSVRLNSGIQVNLRVVEKRSFGAALQYFTGSKAHNIELRMLAQRQGLKVNEYGVFKDDKCLAGKREEDVYHKIGLSFIESELREARGEVKAAQEGKLPGLVNLSDIKGDLHFHSDFSDGHNSILEFAKAAKKRGYRYMAITDHTKHVTVAHGLGREKLKQQIRIIDQLNERIGDFTILKSSECDILEDGSLDLPNEILKELDFTICAIHYKFNLSKEKQTARILKAMENPCFNILAHPTGRLIGKRAPYEVDMEKIMFAAKDYGCHFELNSQPDRLDLNDLHCKMAKEIGLKIVINTDSHRLIHLDYMRYGVNQARRGWLETKDVLNTYDLPKLKKLLKRV